MNKFLSVLSFLFTIHFFAQIPPGYYNTATGTGYVLKTQLHDIIDNNTNSSSTANYGDLWDLYTTSAFRDHWYENDNSLLDLYSENPISSDSYEYTTTSDQCGSYSGEGSCYNREHIMPQSVFNSQYPMYSDAHFVLPSDGYVNGKRNNYPFGKVNSASYTSSNGSKLGQNLNSGYSAGYSGVVFEPIDEFKGDVARALFYFATRYENELTSWNYDMFDGTSTQVFTNAFKNILLTWNQIDQVSAYEIGKNNEVYYNFQGNRNPYIDHPEWVNAVWGTVAAVDEFEDIAFEVYPNPAKEVLFVKTKFDDTIIGYDIFSIYGEKITSDSFISNNSIPLNDLNSGVYILQIHTSDNSFTQKFIIQ